MLKFTKVLPDFNCYDTILHFDPNKALFFDIETTGLSPTNSKVFLIGTVHFDGAAWILSQFLSQNDADETNLLCAFFQLASHFDTLIHFNGSTFDIPYLKERACQSAIDSELYSGFCHMASLDLYQFFRPLKNLLNLPRMNQQTLEQFLNWQRTDQLTGKHMISLFKKYVLSQEQLVADLLLLHNHDDLIGMTHIMKLCRYQTIADNILSTTSLVLDADKGESGQLLIEFELKDPLPADLQIRTPICKGETADEFHLCIQATKGTLSIPCFCGELKYFFADYRNYYYLPTEDQAIHKSIGSFVDPEHRVNAKPATCYTRKCSTFLPQPAVITEPVFRSCHNSKNLYFEYTKEWADNSRAVLSYVKSIISFICK